MEIDYKRAIVLVQVLNQWLEEHSGGENVHEIKKLIDQIETEYQINKPYFDYDRNK